MANSYYDSTLTDAEIQAALNAIDGVIKPANNGKVLAIQNSTIVAKSVSDFTEVPTLGSKTITANGTYDPTDDDLDGYDSVTVNVPNSYAAGDEGKVVSNGALVAQTAHATVTQNGTIDTTLNNSVNVNVSGVTPTGTLNITQNGTYNVTNYASANVNVSGGSGVETAQIPTMTSNTAPSGTASASSTLNSNFAAYKAFDGNQAQSSMQGGWLASSSDYTPYLQYEFTSAVQFDILKIWTANNGTTASRTVTVEGRTNGTWENCLKNGQSVTLTFTQGTYGDSSGLNSIELNGSTYDAIRITGNERFYLGANQTACTFSEVQVYTVSGGGGSGGDIPLLTRSEWMALTAAQKKSYGLVAIQDASAGFDRGKLYYGADYAGEIKQSGTAASSASVTASFTGSCYLMVLALNSEASTKSLDIAVTINGTAATGTTVDYHSYASSGTNRRNYRLNAYPVSVTSGDTIAIELTNRSNYTSFVWALVETTYTTLDKVITTADAAASGTNTNGGVVIYGTFNSSNGGTINYSPYTAGATVQTDSPGTSYKSAYIFWFVEGS